MNTIHHTDPPIEPTREAVTTDGEPAVAADEPRRGTRLAGRRRLGRGRLPRQRSCSPSASSAAPPSTSSPARPCSPSPAAGRCSPCCRVASPASHSAGRGCQPRRWQPRPGAADRTARRPHAQHGRMGVAAVRARARRVDGRPAPPQPRRPRSAGCSTRSSPRSPSAPSAGCTRPPPGRTTSTPTRRPAPLYDVGGHRLHLNCSGSGSPTVVLENGLGATSAELGSDHRRSEIAPPGCAPTTAPDRAGATTSTPHRTVWPSPPTCTPCSHAQANRARTCSSATPPAARTSMTYAAQYPDEVAGMVLLDSMSPDEFTDLPGFASEQSMMRRGLGVLPSLTRLGVAPDPAHVGMVEPPRAGRIAGAGVRRQPTRHAQHARRAVDVPQGVRTGQGADVARRQAARRRHRDRVDPQERGMGRPAGPPCRPVDQQRSPSRRRDPRRPRSTTSDELRGLGAGHRRRHPSRSGPSSQSPPRDPRSNDHHPPKGTP